MVLLDFVRQRGVRLPREGSSNRALWRRLRAAAGQRGVPAIDLIDFDYPCFHRRCDDLSAVS